MNRNSDRWDVNPFPLPENAYGTRVTLVREVEGRDFFVSQVVPFLTLKFAKYPSDVVDMVLADMLRKMEGTA